jgi:glucose/arabinose dehydrogenase
MRRARPLPLALLAGAVLAGAALTACSSAAGSQSPTWQASPAQVDGGEGGGGGVTPIIPVPGPTTDAPRTTPGGASASPAPSPSGSGTGDPAVVATHLKAPVGLTLLPDGTALVGERTTGRIVRVQAVAGRPVPTVRTLPGLDTTGDGGLLDLALSPSYAEDNLIYAYITTATDNRIVDFTLRGPVTPVLTGIPKGRTGNTGRIMFGADGDLYVGTGGAGRPSLAQNAHSLAGKILRVNPIGDPAQSNPQKGSAVWTRGHQQVEGLCASAAGAVFEAENGAAGVPDEINRIVPGDDYGFPAAGASSDQPAATLPASDRSPGGCAVMGGRLWVTSLDGEALLSAPLSGTATSPAVGKFAPDLARKYGRLRTVVAASDGALWLTTSNRDGKGQPVPTDERVVRIVPSGSGASSPV